ncbi:MAG: phage scaffolding protein [Eubacterium sp.]
MTLKEFLKSKNLSDEQIADVLKATGDGVQIDDGSTATKVTDLEEQLKTANAAIKDLKKNNGDNEALQQKVTEYEDQIKTLEKEGKDKIRNLALDNAISGFLKENKAKYPELLADKVDRDKLVVDESGKVEGLGEQGKLLMESYKEMFQETVSGFTPPNPDAPANTGGNYDNLIKNVDNMSVEEIQAQLGEMKF